MTIETTDSFVPVPGGSIFVRQWRGPGTHGSPLVLLHDSLGAVELWRDFPALLAAALNRSVLAYADWSLAPHLGQVRCPVLAIHGDRDEYGSEEFPRRIVNGVSGPSQMILLEDCGHVPHRERPEEIVRLTASFLGRALG